MLGYWATTVVGVHAIIAIGGVYVSCNWMVRGVQFPPPPLLWLCSYRPALMKFYKLVTLCVRSSTGIFYIRRSLQQSLKWRHAESQ